MRVLRARDYVQWPCKTRDNICFLQFHVNDFCCYYFAVLNCWVRPRRGKWTQPPQSLLDSILCVTYGGPGQPGAPQALHGDYTWDPPCARCSAKVKRKLHFRVPREQMTSSPSLVTSVRRPCQARGPKSHLLAKYIILFEDNIWGFCECGDEPVGSKELTAVCESAVSLSVWHCVRRAGCYGHARRVTVTATVKEIFSHLL